jgi:hypothetical protein
VTYFGFLCESSDVFSVSLWFMGFAGEGTTETQRAQRLHKEEFFQKRYRRITRSL